jgi:ABC-2 type transport system ATP-binding protein
VTLLLTTQYLEEADALADKVVLIDHGREIAAGTPAQLKAQVGEQRVDVVAPDAAALERLEQVLRERFTTAVAREQRMISIPAPEEVADLARVTEAIRASEIAVDEIALRRPTLDDAFLALTGHPVEVDEETESGQQGPAEAAEEGSRRRPDVTNRAEQPPETTGQRTKEGIAQ